jgi:metal-responsive CopG/Arc/MetJ family transcriptional regulator
MAKESEQMTVSLPVGLAREIDALAGRRQRSAFITEAAEREVRRRRLAAAKSEEIRMHEAFEERIFIN